MHLFCSQACGTGQAPPVADANNTLQFAHLRCNAAHSIGQGSLIKRVEDRLQPVHLLVADLHIGRDKDAELVGLRHGAQDERMRHCTLARACGRADHKVAAIALHLWHHQAVGL